MSEYLWNEKNNKFTWLSSLYNPFKRANMPLHIFSSAIWRWINEISKVCYKGTQKNGNKYVFSENSCEKIFLKFPRKTFPWNCFFKQNCRVPDTYWECFSAISCLRKIIRLKNIFQKIFHSIFLIYVLIFNGICSQGLKFTSATKR